MKRIMMAVATVAGLGVFAGNAAADPGGFAPPRPGAGGGGGPIGAPGTLFGPGMPADRAPDMYGWNPSFKRFFRLGGGSGGKDCASCGQQQQTHNPLQNPANWGAGGYGQGGPAYNPQGYPPGAYGPGGPMMQGTLVFPHHQFVRSPRDYFMVDVNK